MLFRCKVWSTMSPVSIYGMVTIVQHACQAVGVTAKARQSFKCIELIISIDLNQFAHWYFVLQSNDMPMDLIQLKLMPLGCTWNLSNSKISFQRYLSSIEILFTISPVCYQHSSQPKICVCSINKSILDFVRITINPFQFQPNEIIYQLGRISRKHEVKAQCWKQLSSSMQDYTLWWSMVRVYTFGLVQVFLFMCSSGTHLPRSAIAQVLSIQYILSMERRKNTHKHIDAEVENNKRSCTTSENIIFSGRETQRKREREKYGQRERIRQMKENMN